VAAQTSSLYLNSLPPPFLPPFTSQNIPRHCRSISSPAISLESLEIPLYSPSLDTATFCNRRNTESTCLLSRGPLKLEQGNSKVVTCEFSLSLSVPIHLVQLDSQCYSWPPQAENWSKRESFLQGSLSLPLVFPRSSKSLTLLDELIVGYS